MNPLILAAALIFWFAAWALNHRLVQLRPRGIWRRRAIGAAVPV
jgi:hypothetical protein